MQNRAALPKLWDNKATRGGITALPSQECRARNQGAKSRGPKLERKRLAATTKICQSAFDARCIDRSQSLTRPPGTG